MLALSEVEDRGVLTELGYAAPVLERVLQRKPGPDKYA